MTRRVGPLLASALALLVAVEVLFAHHHAPVFAWHRVPGFHALLGLGASLGVTLAAKALGRALLARPEDRDAP